MGIRGLLLHHLDSNASKYFSMIQLPSEVQYIVAHVDSQSDGEATRDSRRPS
jgi:hypothetical protein